MSEMQGIFISYNDIAITILYFVVIALLFAMSNEDKRKSVKFVTLVVVILCTIIYVSALILNIQIL